MSVGKRKSFPIAKLQSALPVLLAIIVLLLLLASAGCRDGSSPAQAGGSSAPSSSGSSASGAPGGGGADSEVDWEAYEESDERQTLTVMYASEESFYRDIGNLFMSRYPNVEFDVIDLSDTRGEGDVVANYEKVVDGRHPDVLLLDPTLYQALADKGRLMDLEPVIRKDGFDLDGFVPGVVELLRDKGGGRLFGLSYQFVNRALFYNKGLFDRYGIPYPTAGLSWEEALLLAERFPDKGEDGKPLYGLYQPAFTVSPFDLVHRIGTAGKLSAMDPQRTELLYGSKPWAKVFRSVMEGYRSGGIAYPKAPLSDNGDGTVSLGLGRNLFIDGAAAMAIEDVLMMSMMDIAARSTRAATKFEWETVPVPVDPSTPDRTSLFELRDIYAINRNTDQAPLAWEFIRFLHGEPFMKMISKTSVELLARKGLERDSRGRNLSAFYALGPDTAATNTLVPEGFSREFQKIAGQAIDAAVSGELTDDEALARIVNEGQKALDEAGKLGHLETFDLNVFGSARAISN